MNNKDSSILQESALAICGGFLLYVFYPPAILYAEIIAWLGMFGIVNYAMAWSKLDKVFKNCKLGAGNIYPLKNWKKKTDNSIVYSFTVPAGLSSEDFQEKKLAIEEYLGRKVDIRYTYKEILIEVFDQNFKTVYPFSILECKGSVAFPVGYGNHGEIIECDLSTGEPHMLIAGETGSGKSTALRAIITNLILTKDITLHLIDFKMGAEFQIFRKCEKVKSFCRTKVEADNFLNYISDEIDNRYNLFYQNDVVDIKEYNKKFKDKMGYEIIIIDEFAEMQDQKGSITILETVASKARACGIHLIISTQRPDAKVLNGRIKANVTTVLGLKTINEVNSRIIIDDVGLEKLRGSGHAIFRKGFKKELQSPFLTSEKARELLQHTYIDKDNSTKELKKEITNFDFLEGL